MLPEARRATMVTSRAAIAPPIRPPMWPPIEMPGIAKVKTRFRTTKRPIWEAISSTPRSRAMMNAAAIRPKIAPLAPTVMSFPPARRSAPNEPASRPAK